MTDLREAKILFVVNSLSGGGAENSVFAVTRELIKKGFPVYLCALNRNDLNDSSDPLKGIFLLEREWKSGLVATVSNLIKFKRLLLELNPKILIANCELPELYVALASPMLSRKVVVEHTSKPWHGRKLLGAFVRILLRLRGATWITVSSESGRIWLGCDSPMRIPNPIVVKRNINRMHSSKSDVVFVGRLRPEKRPQWAIDASIGNDLNIDLFGDGFLRDNLEKAYETSTDQVRFHGYVANPWDSVSEDSIVVVPSEFEGDGMVVVEAVLRNHPVLLADNADLRKFHLPDSNYFQSESQLLEKLCLWKESNKLLFHASGDVIHSLTKERNIEVISDKWIELLTQLGQEVRS
jgi:glycosyltransferase involved in cell wall biosynthesis